MAGNRKGTHWRYAGSVRQGYGYSSVFAVLHLVLCAHSCGWGQGQWPWLGLGLGLGLDLWSDKAEGYAHGQRLFLFAAFYFMSCEGAPPHGRQWSQQKGRYCDSRFEWQQS